ncbi:hypothetical protein MTO96_026544 [Rhipicephalus appendiculatus]
MTTADLDLLCFYLSSLSADALYSLDERIHFELPKVRGMPLTQAVSAIRVYLEGIAVLKRRLHCMAQIYCWLIALGAMRPWKLYRCRYSKNPMKWVTLINYMRGRSQEVCCTKKTWKAWHTSLLIAVEGGAYHELHCFSAWNKMPCVAIYQPPHRPSELLGRSLLEALWEAVDSCIYWDLDSAHAAARQLLRERLPSTADVGSFTPPTKDHESQGEVTLDQVKTMMLDSGNEMCQQDTTVHQI